MKQKIKVTIRRIGNSFGTIIKKALVEQGLVEVGKTYELDTEPVEPNGSELVPKKEKTR